MPLGRNRSSTANSTPCPCRRRAAEFDDAFGHPGRSEDHLEASESGRTNTRSAVPAQVELAHAQAPECDRPHLILRLVTGTFGWVRRAHIRDGDLVNPCDGGVGQLRGAVQRFENRMRPADTLGFNPEDRPPEPTAQLGGVVGAAARPGSTEWRRAPVRPSIPGGESDLRRSTGCARTDPGPWPPIPGRN